MIDVAKLTKSTQITPPICKIKLKQPKLGFDGVIEILL